jgi:hypothetical protein
MMSEQRRQILAMLAEGKVTAEEAERLIAALERDAPPSPATESRPATQLKYLRVVVDDRSSDDPAKVNIRVPVQLLRAGVRLASLMPPSALEQANEELRRKGFPVDLTKLKPEDIEDLIDQLQEMTVDVEQPDTKVQVYFE